jgi:carboxypeptidase PM20D1
VQVTALAMLEAASNLLASGFAPRQTLYLAFGHDEEVGGSQGAGHIAALLAQRGERLDIILDEGGQILLDGFPPLTTYPTAIIGTAEKVRGRELGLLLGGDGWGGGRGGGRWAWWLPAACLPCWR